MKKLQLIAASAALGAFAAAPASADHQLKFENFDADWGGYIKTNFLISNFSDGPLDTNKAGRDYYSPHSNNSGIPVAADEASEESYQATDFHAKDTRLWLKMKGEASSYKVGGRFEMDFRANVGGNEKVSNSYNPRLRRAFMTFAKGDMSLLIGQEWTLFRNHKSNPESIDSLGAADGMIFGRQPQIRFSGRNFAISLENSETTVLTNGGGSVVTSGDTVLPDLHMKWTAKSKAVNFSIAGVARILSSEQTGTDGEDIGTGISLAGRFNLGANDNIRLAMNYGSGIGRYLGNGISADAVSDGNGDIKAITAYSGVLGYQHKWNDVLRSNISVSAFRADNDTDLTGTGLTKGFTSGRVNLIAEPIKNMLFGVEYLYAKRELENEQDGTLSRLQFTSKLSF